MAASVYYVDFASGADANNGTSKTTPWKHAPGMTGCASNCAAHTPVAGDQFIFKGGVTWDFTIWPWALASSGTSSSTPIGCNGGAAGGGCIYYGVDQTWFAGGSWTRPVFSGGGWQTLNSVCNYDQGTHSGNTLAGKMLAANGQSYWIVDNFEFTGMCSASGTVNFGWGSYIGLCNQSCGDHFTVENSFFHGWTFPSTFTPRRTSSPSPGDYTMCIIGDTHTGSSNGNKNGEIAHNVFDGSDAPNANLDGYATGEGMYGGPGYVYYNVFKDLTEGLDPSALQTVHDNLFLNSAAVSLSAGSNGAGVHEHIFNATFDVCNDTIYNNVVTTVEAGEGLNPAVEDGCNEFIFNNVVTDVTMAILGASANTFLIGSTGSGTGVRYVFNNTCEAGGDATPSSIIGPCYREGGGSLNISNSHTISDLSNGANHGIVQVDSGTITQTNSVTQSKSIANGQGYTFSQTYKFSPTSSSGATVNAGINRTAWCNLIPDPPAQAACKKDTAYAVAYDSVNHVVTVSGRTPNPRPATGNWDAGAYQFASAPANPLVAPAPQVFAGLRRIRETRTLRAKTQ